MPDDTEFRNGYRKPFSWKIIITALLITIALFGGGLMTGYTISKGALSSFDSSIEDIINDVENFQLQFLFLDVLGEDATCPLLEELVSDINTDSYDIGARLEKYGADKIDLDVEEYRELKKKYSRLLVGYWLLSKKMQDVCGSGTNTVVYFYEGNCPECDTQGFILTHLKEKYGERLLVFALDGNIDEPSVQILKDYYDISIYPTIIVNGQSYGRLYTTDELEDLFI